MERFEKDAPHLLDIKISALGLTIYLKNAQTGQYVDFEIHAPWNCKIGSVRSLVTRLKQMCSADLLQNIPIIKKNLHHGTGFQSPLGTL